MFALNQMYCRPKKGYEKESCKNKRMEKNKNKIKF